MSPIHSIPSLESIREEFLELDSQQDRLSLLMELGDAIPHLEKSLCTESNRVLGCQSMVWLVSKEEDGKLLFEASSDAPTVRGLVVLLLAAYNGKTPEQILAFPIDALFKELNLTSYSIPMRSSGLHAMKQRILDIARTALHARGQSYSPDSSQRISQTIAPTRSIAKSRDDFPILRADHPSGKQLVYLDNAASSQRPTQVLEEMTRVYSNFYSNVHRAGHSLALQTTDALEKSREAVRRYIGAHEAQEVIFTSGTTASINLVARSRGDAHLREGDEILLTEMEHHSNIVPWQQLAQRTGAVVRWLEIDDRFELNLERSSEWISDRTKIVAFAAVSNVLGTVNPVRELTRIAHERGSMVLVDAAQAVPHGAIDVVDWDADFVAFSGHKMLGPTGVGVLYGKKSILQNMPAFLGGGGMIKSVRKDGFEPAEELPYRLEAGTPPIVEIIGLKTAIEYLESLGTGSILKHERHLLSIAEPRLRAIPGLKVFGPALDRKCGILTFSINGRHPEEISKLLDAEGIAIRTGHHCAMPLHDVLKISQSCRASFYFYNTEEDAIRFASVLESLSS